MIFTSILFLLFLIFAVIGYYCVTSKFRPLFLVMCNAIFYMTWINSIKEMLSLVLVILITWGGALMINKNIKYMNIIFFLVIIGTVSFLFYYKYFGFLFTNINAILKYVGKPKKYPANPIAPIGISFFTFQALGYVIDVYRGKTNPETNILKYAAYVSFFPVITSGPIERSQNLLPQIQSCAHIKFNYDNLRKGMYIFIYAVFIKLVITNRLSIITDTVFEKYYMYGGAILAFAVVCYTLQIYCDFLSYSLMAGGIAKLLGINVLENFKAPYFAETMQDFWRRWHISLSSWFRDYVYIPMGGNRCPKTRRNINLFLTFLISGLWHGADWTFVIWGCIHGLYQIVGNLTKTLRESLSDKAGINRDCFSFHLWRKCFIFLMVSFAWIFFRTDTIADAFRIIAQIIKRPNIWEIFNGSIFNLGLSQFQICILTFSFLVFLVLDYLKYKKGKNIDEFLVTQNFIFRCMVNIGFIIAILIFGIYGPAFDSQEFIYFRF